MFGVQVLKKKTKKKRTSQHLPGNIKSPAMERQYECAVFAVSPLKKKTTPNVVVLNWNFGALAVSAVNMHLNRSRVTIATGKIKVFERELSKT